MPRFASSLLLLSFIGAGLVHAYDVYDEAAQEEQNRNASCDNNCFYESFPGGSCTDDAACMCTQQKYRERYFCCMGKQCHPSVLPDSITRQSLDCETRGLEFTFDAEAVCGIKLLESSWVAPTVTVTVTADTAQSSPTVPSSGVPASVTSAQTSGSSTSTTRSSGVPSSTASTRSSAASASLPTPTNGSPAQYHISQGLALLLFAPAMLL